MTNSRQGKAARKDHPLFYDEIKKAVCIMLTPTAHEIIVAKAKNKGVSLSEFLEQYARSLLPD